MVTLILIIIRRKLRLRSETSDTMDSWKSRGGMSQRGEEKKREDQRGKKEEESKKMQVRKKVGKSRFTVCFPMICGSRGSNRNLAKAAGAEPAYLAYFSCFTYLTTLTYLN